ncbi:MAG: S46 family peptidase [Limisphaerales bacterium]
MKNLVLGCLLTMLPLAGRADEGMWLFNQPPRALLRDRYHFDATDAWLDHLRKASIRFNSGGSGSFVSRDGLLISNHHVGADALQKLSTKDKNYLRDGFYARTTDQEIKCLDLELNVLESIEDVTARVNAAVPKEADPASAFAARRKIIAEIEKQSQDQTGLRSEVVTLWQGGAYHLYRYKRYTDVRLVFAPEQQMAFFGGDPDNFEFPRFDLDICLFRAYENGQPVHPSDYLRFSREGPREGDLVFVSGNPGRTSRLLTVAELKELRDQAIPFRLMSLKDREVLLESWSARTDENARRAKEVLFGVKNSRKAYDGRLAGLLSPALMQGKEAAEADFKSRLEGKPEWAEALNAYGKIDAAVHILKQQEVKYNLLEGGLAFNSESFRLARTLLRAGAERPKPNGERLREYSESGRVSLELALFSTKPIYADLEKLTLADSLALLADELGADDPFVRQILGGKSPRHRARDLIDGTKARDAAWRKQLYEGGASAVAAARDPMIELARLIDPEARSLRAVYDAQTEVKNQAHAAISRARNALEGSSGYPDATFTLRLAFGAVKSYEANGEPVAPFTTFAGLYAKAAEMKNRQPFDLTPLWERRKASVKMTTPLDFVCTDDIIGGNSGSPVVNRAGDFAGIIFDGNLESLPWDFAFDEKEGRAIAVDSAAILEALEHIFRAKDLVAELLTGVMKK